VCWSGRRIRLWQDDCGVGPSCATLVPMAVSWEGVFFFQGRDLLQLNPKMLCQVRGAEIAMVYQEPTTALNPSLTIGTHTTGSPTLSTGG